MGSSRVPPTLADKFASVNDAGAAIAKSRSEVLRLIKAGELQSVKYGRYRLVTRASIRAYLKLLEQTVH